MFDEAISLLSIWASMHSWLTPTVLFLLLNLMIGTIAVTSGFTSHKPHHHHLQQEPSIHQHHHQQPQITRAPSVLQRLKSINIYSYCSHTHTQTQPTTHVHQAPIVQVQQVKQRTSPKPVFDPFFEPAHESGPLTEEAPARVLVKEDTPPNDYDRTTDDGPSMDEIYSRIKGTTPPAAHYDRQNSDTKPTAGELPVRLPAKMKKSASDKSAFNHFHADAVVEPVNAAPPVVKEVKRRIPAVPKAVAVAVVGGDEEVDAKADDFINKFKQQLKLQRIDSIIRYKDMITRGSGK